MNFKNLLEIYIYKCRNIKYTVFSHIESKCTIFIKCTFLGVGWGYALVCTQVLHVFQVSQLPQVSMYPMYSKYPMYPITPITPQTICHMCHKCHKCHMCHSATCVQYQPLCWKSFHLSFPLGGKEYHCVFR